MGTPRPESTRPAPLEPQTASLSTGVDLEYVERGDPHGPAVVFLHGIGDSLRSFEPVLTRLPESLHGFSLTQRGHGGSSRPEKAYHWQEFSADTAGFLDAVGIDHAVIVGHSMGATVAQRFAIDHPSRTQGLVLSAPFFSLADSPAPRQLWEDVSRLVDPVDPDFVRGFQHSVPEQDVPHEFMEVLVQETMRIPARVWKDMVRCNMQDPFSHELDRIQAPTWLVCGDRDPMVAREDQDRLETAIRQARLIIYEGCGHAPHWEATERFASDLVEFIHTAARTGPKGTDEAKGAPA